MAMTQAQIDEFNRIRATQNDLAASDWADKQGIPASEYTAILLKYPVKNNPLVTPKKEDTIPKAVVPPGATPIANKPPTATPQSTTIPIPTPKTSAVKPRPSSIPHPEEPMNPSANLSNTNVSAIITKWLQDWEVPVRNWDFWKTAIDLQVYDIYPASLLNIGLTQDTPAGTWEADGKRHLAIKPEWLNPGVIAHEQAHNSYALLNPTQKAEFSAKYASLKNTDFLIQLLYSKNKYGLTNDIEGHAEVYRYIGQYMPEQLKIYYPLLF